MLIDNLSHRTRLWYQVAAALAGESVRFLVTTREEDWYRYGLGASSFSREFVEPHLSLQEAKLIYSDFYQQGKVAPNVPSAGWAYEQVAEKQLLIEFVYLITHGKMLAERIEEQVATIEAHGEDRAKLEVLRLVATAQMYGARVSITSLLQHVGFERDPDSTLKSLEREYIVCVDGECEGLHFVRSEHLVRILHTIVPVQHTVMRLLKVLDSTNLVALVASTFADRGLKGNELLPTLVERCRSTLLSVVNAIIEALFLADEAVYVQANKQVFDEAVDQLGASSLLLLTGLTLPSGEVKSFRSLAQQYSDRPAFQVLSTLEQRIRPREETGLSHVLRAFLENLLRTFPLDDQASLADVGQVCTWCHFFNVSVPALTDFLLETRWKTRIFQCDGESTALFLQGFSQLLPDHYSQFVADHQSALFHRFQWVSKTLTIEEKGKDIEVTFIVDERNEAQTPNDQAVWRLRLLRGWFQSYECYRSQGLYPSTGGQKPTVDDSYKNMAGETLDLFSIHAPKNKLYLQLVEEHYASVLVYDWQKQWEMLRQTDRDRRDTDRGKPLSLRPLSVPTCPVIDLQGIGQEAQEAQERRLAEQEAQHPCDLAKGPLLRMAVVRLSPQEHLLLLTLHHIITDGWSNEVLVREVTTLYQAFVQGKPQPLPPLSIQYADYALWQRSYLQGEVLSRQLAYWRSHLAGLSPLPLPTDHPRPPIITFRGTRQSVLLSATLLEGLQALSRQASVTLFMTLLAAFQVLLARSSGEADIAVGTSIANRGQAETEGMIGFFVNVLVMRTDLSGNPPFMQLLQSRP